MTGAQLLCPVRDCHRALQRTDRRWVCALGHSFDVARSGYVNLLQPQERRSRNPGDAAIAVDARRRLHDRGFTEPLLQALEAMLGAAASDRILDAGCGDGYYLGTMAKQTGFDAHGVDISIPAVDAAAKRYPDCQWIVGNADRFLPYTNGSFSQLISITARMNAEEFHRVLQPAGGLLVALPAADDLIELRGAGRDRVQRTIKTFAQRFTLIDNRRVTTHAVLDTDAVRDVLLSIYRPMGKSAEGPMRVTFSLDLLKFQAC